MKAESEVAQSCPTPSDPMDSLFDILCMQAQLCPILLSGGFPRQEYWSGLLCPPPGDLPDPETEPASLVSPALAGRLFTS